MKHLIYIGLLACLLFSCKEKEKEVSSVDPVNWEKRKATLPVKDSLEVGESYLSVYSQIYSQTEHLKHGLTATISIRNTSVSDTLYVLKASYYNTHGALIRSYFNHPIYLVPMETVEIVIDEVDTSGGTGANFLFDWQINDKAPEPLFEAVMISTSGQQGLSFKTEGKRVK